MQILIPVLFNGHWSLYKLHMKKKYFKLFDTDEIMFPDKTDRDLLVVRKILYLKTIICLACTSSYLFKDVNIL